MADPEIGKDLGDNDPCFKVTPTSAATFNTTSSRCPRMSNSQWGINKAILVSMQAVGRSFDACLSHQLNGQTID